MQVGSMVGDGKSDTKPAGVATARLRGAVKGIENKIKLLLGYARSCVGDTKDCFGMAISFLAADFDLYSAPSRGVTNCIAYDVLESVAKHVGITGDDEVTRCRGDDAAVTSFRFILHVRQEFLY